MRRRRLAPVAEVRRVGAAGGGGAGRDRGAGGYPDPDVAERPIEDVRPMARRMHPGVDDRARRAEAARSPGDVLADAPGVGAVEVMRRADTALQRRAAGALVREEALTDHQPRV